VNTLYCAFNITKQSFVNLGVRVASTPFSRLRGLIGQMRMRSDEAVWVVPSHGVHTIGLRFPIDVLYLDRSKTVVHAIENLSPQRIPALKWKCASVLQLPARSIFDSGTQVGDQLLIGTAQDLQIYWESQGKSHSSEGTTKIQTASKQGTAKWVPWPIGGNPERG